MPAEETRQCEWARHQAAMAGDERAWQALYDAAFEPPSRPTFPGDAGVAQIGRTILFKKLG